LNYSNAGIGSISKEVIEEDLKGMNAKSANITTVAKPGRTLAIENSDIIKGALELAQEDGDAKAKIVDKEGNLVDISTRNFPEKHFFNSNAILLWDNFIEKIRDIWPINKNG